MGDYARRIRESAAGRIRGPHTSVGLQQTVEMAVAGLSPRGRDTLSRAIAAVRSEPFLADFLDSGRVILLPDESACRRYGGYTQTGREAEPIDGALHARREIHIVHLCQSVLESGNVEEARGILSHELFHATEREVAGRPTAELVAEPVIRSLAEQLATLPEFAGLEHELRQYLHEKIRGYPQAEILAILEQLPQTPALRLNDRLWIAVVCELRRLDAAGLPETIRRTLIDDLRVRTEAIYAIRIGSARGEQASGLEAARRYALLSLDQALAYRKLEQMERKSPYEIRCPF